MFSHDQKFHFMPFFNESIRLNAIKIIITASPKPRNKRPSSPSFK